MPHHIILDDMSDTWELLIETDSLQAELIKSYLEALGLQVMLVQEAAGKAYGFTIGKMGEAQVLVSAHQFGEAQEALAAFLKGDEEEAV